MCVQRVNENKKKVKSVGMLEEAVVMQHAEGGDLELDQNSNSVRALRYSTGVLFISSLKKVYMYSVVNN